MDELSQKIGAIEAFLKEYEQFEDLYFGNLLANEGGFAQIYFRAKLAYVLTFLESMGEEVIVSSFLNEVEVDEECYFADYSMPDEDFFDRWVNISPYFQARELKETKYCLDAAIYEDGSEDGLTLDDFTEAVKEDFLGTPAKEENKKGYADVVKSCFAYPEYALYLYSCYDLLGKYYYPVFTKTVEEKDTFSTHLKEEYEDEVDAKEYLDIELNISVGCGRSSVEANWYLMNEKDCPDLYALAFGQSNDGYNQDWDFFRQNLVFGIQKALSHLYLFRLNRKISFLPEELKDGDKKIFPNFRVA